MNERIVIATAAAVILAGCGPKGEERAGSTDAVQASPSASSRAAVAQSGDAPAFASPYPGARVVANMNAIEDGRRGGVYAFQTEDAPEKVFTFYKARAESAGLTTASTISSPGGQVYAAEGEAGDVAVTVAPADGQNYVQVTWSAN